MTTTITVKVPDKTDYHVDVHLMNEELGITKTTVESGQDRVFYIYKGLTMMIEELPNE